MWQFSHGRSTVSAPILDHEWLEQFRERKVVLLPGERALRCRVKFTYLYDDHGELIGTRTEIEKVLEAIWTGRAASAFQHIGETAREEVKRGRKNACKENNASVIANGCALAHQPLLHTNVHVFVDDQNFLMASAMSSKTAAIELISEHAFGNCQRHCWRDPIYRECLYSWCDPR